MKKKRSPKGMLRKNQKAVRRSVRRVGAARVVHQVHVAGIAFVKNARSFLAGVGFALLLYLAMRWIGG